MAWGAQAEQPLQGSGYALRVLGQVGGLLNAKETNHETRRIQNI